MIRTILSIFICFSAYIVMAQQDHLDSVKKINPIEEKKLADSIVLKSPISSLTYQEYIGYKTGEGMGMAKPAELNNYPSPKYILDMGKELKLSENQKAQLKMIYVNMKKKAEEMGTFILQEERKLNDSFASGKPNEGSIIYYSNKIGLFQGELRNAHLQAHLKAHGILNADQIKKCNKLMAYSN